MNTRLTQICFAVAALLLGSLARASRGLAATELQGAGLCRPVLRQLDRVLSRYQRRLRLGPIRNGAASAGDFKASPNGWLVRAAPSVTISRPAPGSGASKATSTMPISTAPQPLLWRLLRSRTPGSPPARARLGYAGWNNWLPYITGGGAFGNIKAQSPLGDSSKTQWGWTAGAGIEWAFLANWSAKVEYLYVDLGIVRLRHQLRRSRRQR